MASQFLWDTVIGALPPLRVVVEHELSRMNDLHASAARLTQPASPTPARSRFELQPALPSYAVRAGVQWALQPPRGPGLPRAGTAGRPGRSLRPCCG